MNRYDDNYHCLYIIIKQCTIGGVTRNNTHIYVFLAQALIINCMHVLFSACGTMAQLGCAWRWKQPTQG